MANLISNKENILFIVEGEKSEPNLIRHLQRTFKIENQFDVFSYETSIYELYDDLSKDKYLDILLLLKEKTTDQSIRIKLSNKFSKIYLLFDFDPHYHKFDNEKVKLMLGWFNDSTDGGKLYINYPMIESFRHLNQMPDIKFMKRTVKQSEILEYKSVINKFPTYTNYSKLNFVLTRDIVIHHLSKIGYIIEGKKLVIEELCYDIDSSTSIALLIEQIESLSQDKLYVLNTCVLYVIDLMQFKLVKGLQKHQIKFD